MRELEKDGSFVSIKRALLTLIPVYLVLAACVGDKGFDGATSSTYSGNIIVTTITTEPTTGPGLVTMFSSTGSIVSTLRDFYSSGEWATGSAFFPPYSLYLGVEGSDRIELIDLRSNSITSITSVQLTSAALRGVAVTTTGEVLIAEGTVGTVERFSNGSRDGNPYIAATVGACALSSPFGVAVNQRNNDIAVVSAPGAAGRLSIYDSAATTCKAHITAGTIGAGTPQAIAYHAPTNTYLVTSATTHAIHAYGSLGTSPVLIYLNSAIINTPRAIATDSEGYIYVGSSGTETVEKLTWSGSGAATRVGTGPLIGPGIFSQNPTSITVVP